MTEPDKLFQAMHSYLESLPKPKPAKASQEFRDWWDKKLVLLKNQCLSELHRKNGVSPKLIIFHSGDGIAIVDIGKQVPNWGDAQSKDKTAYVHQLGALIPDAYASVLITEAWTLTTQADDMERAKKFGIADHPERGESIVMQTLHVEREDNTINQLTTMIEVVKVLGNTISPEHWADTKYGKQEVVDAFDGDEDQRFHGRFIYGDNERRKTDGNS